MKLIRVTICAAFQDAYNVSADNVREMLFRAVSDGLEAEVYYTEGVQEVDHPTPDPDLVGDDESAFEVWQQTAREQLDRLRPEQPCDCGAVRGEDHDPDCAVHQVGEK